MRTVAGELCVLFRDDVVHREPFGNTAFLVGRNPDNDLVLSDSRVSGYHMVLRWTSRRLYVHDLASTNGTWLNDEQVTGARALADGDVLRLGSAVRLRVVLHPQSHQQMPRTSLMLSDLSTGLGYPILNHRFRIGSREDADLRLASGPPVAAALFLREDGSIWLATTEGERRVDPGEPFEVGGHRMILRDDFGLNGQTERETSASRTPFPYRLRVAMGGASAPEACVEDIRTGARHTVRAENRVALLYVLAQQAQRDRERGVTDREVGWTPDTDAMLGIWGKRHESLGTNNFQVLLCRLRKEIENAGFDGWFIEKRAGHTRVVLDEIQVEGMN